MLRALAPVLVATVVLVLAAGTGAAGAKTRSCGNYDPGSPATYHARNLRVSHGATCKTARKVAAILRAVRTGAGGNIDPSILVGKAAWKCHWKNPLTDITQTARCRPFSLEDDKYAGRKRVAFEIVNNGGEA